MTMRRGLRHISELPSAVSLGGAIQEVEVNGVGYQTPLGSAISILAVTEERPTTPSPYDDEFDGPAISAEWTQTAGTAADYDIQFSRALIKGTNVELRQSLAGLTNPLRIVFGFNGIQATSGWVGASMTLRGASKWLRMVVDDNNVATNRRVALQRLSNVGAWEADFWTTVYANNEATIAVYNTDLEFRIIVDGTNATVYFGAPRNPRGLSLMARATLGALDAIVVQGNMGMSLDYFRVDRATTAYAFPLAWAG